MFLDLKNINDVLYTKLCWFGYKTGVCFFHKVVFYSLFLTFQRIKEEVQTRKVQGTCWLERRDDEVSFTKPAGHDEFHASLSSSKLVSAECRRDLPRSPGSVEQVIRPQYKGQQKFLLNSVYDKSN